MGQKNDCIQGWGRQQQAANGASLKSSAGQLLMSFLPHPWEGEGKQINPIVFSEEAWLNKPRICSCWICTKEVMLEYVVLQELLCLGEVILQSHGSTATQTEGIPGSDHNCPLCQGSCTGVAFGTRQPRTFQMCHLSGNLGCCSVELCLRCWTSNRGSQVSVLSQPLGFIL